MGPLDMVTQGTKASKYIGSWGQKYSLRMFASALKNLLPTPLPPKKSIVIIFHSKEATF